MEKITKGQLVLLMGPSGSGKNTLKAHIHRVYGTKLCYAVSCTTRAMRPGEREGLNYYFKTVEEFTRMRNAGEFLEWAEYGGNMYGLPKSEVLERMQHNAVVFREIECKGYLQLLQQIPRERITLILIDGGNWETLKTRVLARAPMSEAELAGRKQSYDDEMSVLDTADYVITNENGKVNAAENAIHDAVEKILQKHRSGGMMCE